MDKYKMAKHFELTITDTMDAADTVRAYKSQANVEKIFKSLKSFDLHIRPIHHDIEDRTPASAHPVAAAVRSPETDKKASKRLLADGTLARGFRALLNHLATRTRNTLRAADLIDAYLQTLPK